MFLTDILHETGNGCFSPGDDDEGDDLEGLKGGLTVVVVAKMRKRSQGGKDHLSPSQTQMGWLCNGGTILRLD